MITLCKGRSATRNGSIFANPLIIILLILLASGANAEPVPYTFSKGTTAFASEVNANFNYLGDRSWGLSGTDLYYNSGKVGIGTTSPGQKLSVTGTIESTSGGFKFPDGSIQESAAEDAMTSGQAIGNTDISTASTSYVDMEDMNVVLSGAGDYLIMYSGNLYGSPTNNGRFVIDIDGTDEIEGHIIAYSAPAQAAIQFVKTSLPSGDHTFKIQWKTVGSGTVYQRGTEGSRILTVLKISR